MGATLKVNEIFLSIQGEGTGAGLPCVLVRLTGCNLRCRWCDTPYAWEEGSEMTLDEVLRQVASFGCGRVEVTGGEPLIQPAAGELLRRLCDAGYETLVETNGSQDISAIDPRVARVVDFKCPGSGADGHNCWQNAAHLTERDEVKFVIADRADYEFARNCLLEHELGSRCAVTFQPAAGELAPAALAGWIVADGLDVRLGVQLHRIIWPDRDRGV